METYQEGAEEERAELNRKIQKLAGFVESTRFADVDRAEQIRLIEQLGVMRIYSAILTRRIVLFELEA